MIFLINATMGLSVLLPCLVPPPPPPLKDTRIYWQTAEDEYSEDTPFMLYFFNQGKEEHQQKALQYRNRTEVDLSQLPSGNFSLVLKNVTEEDNQTTFCCFYSNGSQYPAEVSRITLLVLEPDEPGEPDEPENESGSDHVLLPGWAPGLQIAGVLLLIACVAGMAYKGAEAKIRAKHEERQVTMTRWKSRRGPSTME